MSTTVVLTIHSHDLEDEWSTRTRSGETLRQRTRKLTLNIIMEETSNYNPNLLGNLYFDAYLQSTRIPRTKPLVKLDSSRHTHTLTHTLRVGNPVGIPNEQPDPYKRKRRLQVVSKHFRSEESTVRRETEWGEGSSPHGGSRSQT